ncbi:hypothetical protein [Sphingomonas bacterium]|uniref:hypothetical protein n=1 Tax=Sphingomonas bacterium TaxID=1895847 RepID=UPI0015768EBA|nr:hypothetical protein [Sphingomonas bacterium]
MRITLPLAALLAALPVAPAPAADPPERFSTLVVYGDDPCPRSSGDEIVVCARKPENERYRIPKSLRRQPYNAARDGSWAGTAKVLEMVSKQGIPNSCSPIGTYGQSGCFQKFLADNRRP